MGIIDRLGDVIKSYLSDDEDGPVFQGSSSRRTYTDPDLEAAFEELDDYLKGGGETKSNAGSFGQQGAYGQGASGQAAQGQKTAGTTQMPESLKADFAELGVSPGASEEVCKAAYKKLLKIHHPDRHAGHPGNMKKATEKSARINAAYERIEQWRQTGKAN
jgi:DnaJ-domain-containing protein 1